MYHSRIEEFVFESERSVDKEHYLDYDIKSMAVDCKQLDDLVSKLFIECEISRLNKANIPTKHATAEARLKRNLRSLVWHLFKAQKRGRDCYLRIPLSNGAFSGCSAQNPHKISREVREIVHVLREHGIIQVHIGYRCETSKHTRVRASVNFLLQLSTLPWALCERYVERDAIIFRRKVKEKYTYHSKKLNRMVTKNVKRTLEIPRPFENEAFDLAAITVSQLNKSLQNSDIGLSPSIQDEFTMDSIRAGLRDVDFGSKYVSSIFHVGKDNTVSYGRMHKGWWQSIPKGFRKYITIDGEKVVELDYSAQILNMAASHSKHQLLGDPYSIDLGVSFIDGEMQRKIVKSCVVIMMNTKSKISAMHAVKNKLIKDNLWNSSIMNLNSKLVYGFFDRILTRHPFLNRYAFKGLGMMFFYRDSEVARGIIRIFLDEGKIVLPIHDGFLAKEEDEELLRSAMERAWFETFETAIGIKKE